MNLKNIHPQVFRYFKHDKNEDVKFLHEIFYWKQKIPQDVQEKILQILQISYEIKDSLIPLQKLGIPIGIDLVGGALRDIVLKKHKEIKDLDFLISFHRKNIQEIKKIENCTKSLEIDLSEKKYQTILYRNKDSQLMDHWKDKNSNDSLINVKVFDLIALLLAKNFTVEKYYFPRYEIQNYEDYIDHAIIGVIKIKKDDWSLPVDIIISDYHIESFIDKFDFDICRIYLNIQNFYEIIHHEYNQIKSVEKFFEYIKIRKSFLYSAKNKELSFPIKDSMTVYHVKRSLEIHLAQLEKKYPWKIKIEEISSDFLKNQMIDPEIGKYIQIFFQKRELQKNIDTKKETKIITKI